METLQQHQDRPAVPDRAVPGEQSCLCWKQNAESRDCLCFWELPGMALTGGVEMNNLCSPGCVWLWKPPGRCFQRAAVDGPGVMSSSGVLEHKLSLLQPQAGAAGLGWGGQEWVRNGLRCQGQAGKGGTAPQESLRGKRSHREMGNVFRSSCRSNLQVYSRKESFGICAFSAIRPAKGKCFCDTRAALAEKDPNKPFGQILSVFKLRVSIPEHEHSGCDGFRAYPGCSHSLSQCPWGQLLPEWTFIVLQVPPLARCCGHPAAVWGISVEQELWAGLLWLFLALDSCQSSINSWRGCGCPVGQALGPGLAQGWVQREQTEAGAAPPGLCSCSLDLTQ